MTVEIGLFTLAGFYLLFVAPVGLNVITVEFCLTLFRVGVRPVRRGSRLVLLMSVLWTFFVLRTVPHFF